MKPFKYKALLGQAWACDSTRNTRGHADLICWQNPCTTQGRIGAGYTYAVCRWSKTLIVTWASIARTGTVHISLCYMYKQLAYKHFKQPWLLQERVLFSKQLFTLKPWVCGASGSPSCQFLLCYWNYEPSKMGRQINRCCFKRNEILSTCLLVG